MQIVGNSLNGFYPSELIEMVRASKSKLVQIDLAVAYVSKMDEVFELAEATSVPLRLFALADGKFPNVEVARRLVEHRRLSWELFLTRDFYHPKIMWFKGVGVYIGSANLSDKAWNRNSECGIWMDQDELEYNGWTVELLAIFSVILGRSSAAGLEHIVALEELAGRRAKAGLDRIDKGFEADCEELLGNIKGKQAPKDVTKVKQSGGAAKLAFMDEWGRSLTILRKLSSLLEKRKSNWPSWVNQSTHPTIVQDQATEWWWNSTFRESGESEAEMHKAHRENVSDPDAAAHRLVEGWLKTEGAEIGSSWHLFMNENPKKLYELLSQASLGELTKGRLAEVLYLCHSSKAHARQVRKSDYGLVPGDTKTEQECCELMAEFLWKRSTRADKSVKEILEFVIWGDKNGTALESDCAARIWSAARDDKWRLPHLGVNILGELIGYARPDEYPPRNNRVSKTLYALGFEGITYG